MTEDEALIAHLSNICIDVKNYWETYENLNLSRVRANNYGQKLFIPDCFVEPFERYMMDCHSELGKERSLFFGVRQLHLHPTTQAKNLIRVAMLDGAERAVEWYRRLHNIRKTGMRLVATVYGLNTDKSYQLRDDVTVMPLAQLGQSYNANCINEQYISSLHSGINVHSLSKPIAAVLEFPEIEGEEIFKDEITLREYDTKFSELEHLIKAFTLKEAAAPVIGQFWYEFTDPDLTKAEMGMVPYINRFDGAIANVLPVEIDGEALEWINNYLQLGSKIKGACDIAIERLNRARRSMFAADKAIDGAICLEALLGDNDRGEIGYKLRLRAALFLEECVGDRKKIRDSVKKFYDLRSKVVHGTMIKHADENYINVQSGLDICARVLRKMVINKQLVNWCDLELSVGIK